VVGTGGGALGSLYGTSPNSEIRNNHTFGVLVLTLRPDGPNRLVGVGDSSFRWGPAGAIELTREAAR